MIKAEMGEDFPVNSDDEAKDCKFYKEKEKSVWEFYPTVGHISALGEGCYFLKKKEV